MSSGQFIHQQSQTFLSNNTDPNIIDVDLNLPEVNAITNIYPINALNGHSTSNTNTNNKYPCISIHHYTDHDPYLPTKQNNIILTKYMKSLLSNRYEIDSFNSIWNRWGLLYRPSNFNININNLSVDNLRNITSFLSLNDYAFCILQVNKRFHHVLSPKYSPNIMRELLLTDWDQRIDFTLNKDQLPQFDNFWNANPKELLEEWEIIGTFAWQNTKRIQYEDILSIINKDRLKKKSYYSSLLLLHFLYKCRYGGISTTVELKELLYQLISNGGGLGMGYMITFYFDEFF